MKNFNQNFQVKLVALAVEKLKQRLRNFLPLTKLFHPFFSSELQQGNSCLHRTIDCLPKNFATEADLNLIHHGKEINKQRKNFFFSCLSFRYVGGWKIFCDRDETSD
jgi:hypothetical protein